MIPQTPHRPPKPDSFPDFGVEILKDIEKVRWGDLEQNGGFRRSDMGSKEVDFP